MIIPARTLAPLLLVLALGCPPAAPEQDAGATGPGSVTCKPCVGASECGALGACVQIGEDDACAARCGPGSGCAADQQCSLATAFNNEKVQVCIPNSNTCAQGGVCGVCPTGTVCDVAEATCVATDPPDSGASACGTLLPPASASCCHSCDLDSGSCQTNGCYGGWFCDSASCRCKSPPSSCVGDGGTPNFGDAGVITGSIGPNGGEVSRLYFAVVGDTRPADFDSTATYPTAVIRQIYGDIQNLNPRPQFVVATGDYMFAYPNSAQGELQLSLYSSAKSQYTEGPVFAALGNHECTGATATNCSLASPTGILTAYMNALVHPLGKTLPYYEVPISAADHAWTAKVLLVACNLWGDSQKQWLEQALSRPTTFTFVVNHQTRTTSEGPCVADLNALLLAYPYTLAIVGHTHTYYHSGKQVVVGTGGAPMTGSAPFGFATVEQLTQGFRITQYEASTSLPVSSYLLQ